MKISWDSEVDIMMVELGDVIKRRKSGKFLDIGEAFVDLAEDGTILAIEIKDASKKYPLSELQQHPATYDDPISLEEAAPVAGVSAQALRKACERGRLAGKKIGRNWTVTIATLTDYLNSRAHEGPGSASAAS